MIKIDLNELIVKHKGWAFFIAAVIVAIIALEVYKVYKPVSDSKENQNSSLTPDTSSTKSSIIQVHSGNGDNVGGNKTTNKEK
ncbi:hypothetical protein [Ferruginibacter sp. SUN106]|uniref:hypothetical protein n=1 Tax=Ferruginibacter sp. SUN106 TaxID=2978348 RepID=UPI003D36DAED